MSVKLDILAGIDTQAKLKHLKEKTIRNYYNKIFKDEKESLAKKGISIKSSIGTAKTRKNISFRIPTKQITMKKK